MSLPGWRIENAEGVSLISPVERELFASLWRQLGGNALEIGSLSGVTAAEVARTLPGNELWCLDTYDLWQSRVIDWLRNQEPNMHLLICDAKWLTTFLPQGFFSIALVDGAHTYEACKSDLEACLHLVDPSGRILIHDYTVPCFADAIPPAAKDTIERHGWVLQEVCGISTAHYERADQ